MMIRSALEQLQQSRDDITVPAQIFAENIRPPTVEFKLPEADERLDNTSQLVHCLGLLKASQSPDATFEPTAHKWIQAIKNDTEEEERLHTKATDVMRVFKRDDLKNAKVIAEVVLLASILKEDDFHELLREFCSGIKHPGPLNIHQLEGLAQLIQGADPAHLRADDLVRVLELLSNRLMDTHQQPSPHMYQLTMAVSHVLDAMADTNVTKLDREKLHEPLSSYLNELKKKSDPFLVYQAAYAHQALLCIPDNETTWQAAMRRTSKVLQGVSELVSATKGLDLNRLIGGLKDIQNGLGESFKVVFAATSTYDRMITLVDRSQSLMESLKEGLSFEKKRDWYSALRGADVLIRQGELATFKQLVCSVPCRYDPAFQWGLCHRLGEMAANPRWDDVTRQSAIEFLGEIYKNDEAWGRHGSVKQWVLNILMQLSSSSGGSQGMWGRSFHCDTKKH